MALPQFNGDGNPGTTNYPTIDQVRLSRWDDVEFKLTVTYTLRTLLIQTPSPTNCVISSLARSRMVVYIHTCKSQKIENKILVYGPS